MDIVNLGLLALLGILIVWVALWLSHKVNPLRDEEVDWYDTTADIVTGTQIGRAHV